MSSTATLSRDPGHHRRRPRRPDGGRSRARGGHGSRSLRRQGLGRAQVPDRRQGRPEPDPRRAATRLSTRVTARGSADVGRWLDDFDADALREWARGFGIETYIGTSGRVFPMDRKAAPLLRGWVRRLRDQGVRFHVQHRWLGWGDDGALRFATPDGERDVHADADRTRARRRQLARTRFRRRVGALAAGTRHRRRAAAAIQLRLRHRLERTFRRSPCGGAAEAGGRPLARRSTVANTRCRANASSPPPASKAAWSMRCRRRCATRSRAMATRTLHLDLAPGRDLDRLQQRPGQAACRPQPQRTPAPAGRASPASRPRCCTRCWTKPQLDDAAVLAAHDQAAAADACARAADRRSDQQRRRRAAGSDWTMR